MPIPEGNDHGKYLMNIPPAFSAHTHTHTYTDTCTPFFLNQKCDQTQ